jgi:hypothetical protein
MDEAARCNVRDDRRASPGQPEQTEVGARLARPTSSSRYARGFVAANPFPATSRSAE